MIQIYLPDNTDYEHNGDAVLDPMSCECEMVLNDEWHLELEHPIDEDGKFKMIIKEAVISAPTPIGERQLFRIYETQKDDETLTAYAFPVFFDSKDDHILLDVRPTGKNGQQALDILCAESKYSGASDITTGATAYYVRRNLMEAINGDIDQSFINRWGGEILYDNYRVIINQHVGGDYGVRAEFGYNLEGIEEHVDMSEVVTRIIPVAYNGHTLDGDSPWVDSPRINDYAKIYTKEIYFDDVKMIEDASEDEEGCLTLEELWHKLIIRCNELFAQGIDLPKISYDVNMISLEGTEEYKGYEILEKVGLGDTVHCRHKELGIETNARAISIKYDCIDRRNIEIVLGDYQKSAFDSDFELQKAIETVLDSKSKTVMAERVRGILDAVNTQLRLQSTVAKKVHGRAFEISDLDPESELYGCMIFGSQGLQIATERTADGRNWNWRTAITAKGIVADAIITGLLSDKTGRNYWNLDTGEFRLSSEAFLVDDDNIEEYVNKKLETVRNITMILGNEYQGIPTDYQGNYADFPIVQTTVQVLYGQIDVTASCQYTIQRSAGVTGSWDNPTKIYTVTALTADTGWVDITAAYLGLFTVTKRFNIAKQKNGEPGAQGIPGKDGGNGTDGRTSYFHVMYAPNDNPTSSQMSKEPNSYIGTYVDFIETDSRDPLAYSWVKIEGADGKDGTNGIPGTNGIDGKTSYLHMKYSDDGSTFTADNGETPGKWIGQYVDFVQADSTVFSDYVWTKIQGPQGIQGLKGADGKQYYTWLKYADTPTSGMSDDPTDKAYIGLAYNKESATESNNYNDYTWSLIKGEKGDTGVAGQNGADGKQLYTWVKYATSASGANMSDDPSGKTYIGLAYNKTTAAESTDASDYTWSLIKGDKGDTGAAGRTYFMEASTLVVKRSQDNSMAPNYITLSAYYRDGTGTARTEYAGRFEVEESLDGATWTTVYTSSANEPSITHSLYSALATSAGGIIATASGKAIGIPRDVVALRCTLYAAGGTTQMLDMQSVAVVVDVDALTHEDIFGLLTKNGSLQGIYMSGGQLYINGTYMRIGKIASKNGRVYFDLDNNVLACSKMVSADTGQSIQTVADVGYPAGTSSSSGSRLRIYPQGYEGSAIQIHADTSNKGYVEGPSERMDIKCADTKTVINMYPTYMKLSAYPEPGSSSAKYAQIGLYSDGSSYDTGHVEIKPRLDVKGPLKVSGAFTASGTKSRIVETENYSHRLQYCYEMATPMFGDLGEGVTDENGECCVSLDDVFAETVATGIEYQVFLQKEGPGDIWVGEKYPSYFTVRGTENIKFAWEIKAKQKDFECMRLENADFEGEDIETILSVYEEEYTAEVARIIEEQEGLLYETT
ncbi:phage tail spike protein [Blautia marasmi]|uniref:phage tail spike protein n=1 Tax=Blautia marasmi TaxID=1917868 RepID=UPI0035119852